MESKTNNLEIYDSLKEVPNKMLKTITAGRLKGMSDIKPQWRIKRLTEVFGPCGIGWKIQNLKFTYERVESEIVCNCYLEFLYKYQGEWSEPIPGVGGSNFSTWENKTDWETKEKIKSLYVSDEAEKMAYTDALSVATKMIGLAGDIYMGYGGKYDTPVAQEQKQTKEQPKTGKIKLTDEGYAYLISSGTEDDINKALKTRSMTEAQEKDLRNILTFKFKK